MTFPQFALEICACALSRDRNRKMPDPISDQGYALRWPSEAPPVPNRSSGSQKCVSCLLCATAEAGFWCEFSVDQGCRCAAIATLNQSEYLMNFFGIPSCGKIVARRRVETYVHTRAKVLTRRATRFLFCADRWILGIKSRNVQPGALEYCFYVQINTPFMIQLAFPGIVGRVSNL